MLFRHFSRQALLLIQSNHMFLNKFLSFNLVIKDSIIIIYLILPLYRDANSYPPVAKPKIRKKVKKIHLKIDLDKIF